MEGLNLKPALTPAQSEALLALHGTGETATHDGKVWRMGAKTGMGRKIDARVMNALRRAQFVAFAIPAEGRRAIITDRGLDAVAEHFVNLYTEAMRRAVRGKA